MASEQPQPAGSVSRVDCLASVAGRGEAKFALLRHLAPITVNALLRASPLASRVNVQPAMVCLFTDLRVGVEKPKTKFARGDVAFLPSGSLLCFFLSDVASDRPLNPVGKVDSGLEVLDAVRPGDSVRILASPEPSAKT